MGACGIICEYNPFHNGHAYQIQTIKSDYCENVVCVMSGNFTQRAEPACQDKSVRAQNAVANGADIVIELPFPFSSLSAEGFANAGVKIMAESGMCSHIAFGSECGEIKLLSDIAQILDDSFFEKVKKYQSDDPKLSFARARCELIELMYGKEYADVLRSPNDILAVEYLRANNAIGKPLMPIALKRDTPMDGRDENFASASYIRDILKTVLEDCRGMDKSSFPASALKDMPENVSLDTLCFDNRYFQSALQISLMLKNPSELEHIAEVSKGAEHSIVINALSGASYEKMCESMSSKSFTDAKVRRMLLFSFLGIDRSFMKCDPLYTYVLSYNERGKALLRNSRENRRIIIASCVSNIKASEYAFKQYLIAKRAEEVLKKCRLKPI